MSNSSDEPLEWASQQSLEGWTRAIRCLLHDDGVEVAGLVSAVQGFVPFEPNAWRIPANAGLCEALRHVWWPIETRAPRFVSLLPQRVSAVALIRRARGEELAYLVVHPTEWPTSRRVDLPPTDLAACVGRGRLEIVSGSPPLGANEADALPIRNADLLRLLSIHSRIGGNDLHVFAPKAETFGDDEWICIGSNSNCSWGIAGPRSAEGPLEVVQVCHETWQVLDIPLAPFWTRFEQDASQDWLASDRVVVGVDPKTALRRLQAAAGSRVPAADTLRPPATNKALHALDAKLSPIQLPSPVRRLLLEHDGIDGTRLVGARLLPTSEIAEMRERLLACGYDQSLIPVLEGSCGIVLAMNARDDGELLWECRWTQSRPERPMGGLSDWLVRVGDALEDMGEWAEEWPADDPRFEEAVKQRCAEELADVREEPPPALVMSERRSPAAGKVQLVDVAVACSFDGVRRVSNHGGWIEIVGGGGEVLARHAAVHGAELLVSDGMDVELGTPLARWPRDRHLVVSPVAGTLELENVVEGINGWDRMDEESGLSAFVIGLPKNPTVDLRAELRVGEHRVVVLPSTVRSVYGGDPVSAGEIIAWRPA